MSEHRKEGQEVAAQADIHSFYKRAFGKLVPGEDWMPYRGTTWFDPEEDGRSLIEFAEAEAESMADSERRHLQTSIDPSRGISIEFKGEKKEEKKKMYDRLVQQLFELKMNRVDTHDIIDTLK